jgi:hypothetical protein
MTDDKADFQRYLARTRDAMVWKLEGLSEYDARRPMTITGTNLLGIIKHVASITLGYFGDTFDRPHGEELPWLDENAEPNADMYATADESRADLLGLWERAWAHADRTIEELDLAAVGHVPWWPAERREVTLHRVLVHMTDEVGRHAGHMDILRELIDGEVGRYREIDNMAPGDQAWWTAYVERVDQAARQASAT